MTAILLDTVFLCAFQTLLERSATSSTNHCSSKDEQSFSEICFEHSVSPGLVTVAKVVDCYSMIYQAVYGHAEGVASLMSLAASCLCQPSGRLVYLGVDTLGAMWSVSPLTVHPSI